jgi:CubicO group peptidase (beta-lactamase class C family)
MLTVGLFAVLSWDSTFPNRREVMVLTPLPVRGSTLFLAKVAAVATALALTVATLHVVTGVAWPLAFAQSRSADAPALTYLPAQAPVKAADLEPVLNRDLAQALRSGPLAAGTGAGLAVGVLERGTRRVLTWGVAKPDSVFEIGSLTKTFTGLLLAQMAADERVSLDEPVRALLPPHTVPRPAGREITLLDLATHQSGLPRMPDNFHPADKTNPLADYGTAELYEFLREHGVGRERKPGFEYSNLGFGLLGQALAERAGIPYPELIRRQVLDPLGMKDTTIQLTGEQQSRFVTGHDSSHHAVRAWDLDALAGAGALRSTAGDMLTFLQAQLHPENLPAGTLSAAIAQSHRLRSVIPGGSNIALAWFRNPATGVYTHNGGTGGFTSAAFFYPKGDYAAVVLLNSGPGGVPFSDLMAEHVRQRLAGEPALSLDAVQVPASGGAAGLLRSFAAFWITMLAAGAFVYCCVLGMQGMTAQLLPRRWFLRVSSILQLASFSVFVCGYFLLKPPQFVLTETVRQPLLAWVPTYWFVGLFQQLQGTLHPALKPLADRAWAGLAIAGAVTALAYTLSYLRTLRQIVEEPDIVPGARGGTWLPAFGSAFATVVVQFTIRTLLRSRQHRMMLAFYFGIGFALSILLLQMPAAQELGADTANAWHEVSLPLIASSMVIMGFSVIGMRVLFAMPLDLRSNWVFRVTPARGGRACLNARRGAFVLLGVMPTWSLFAILLFWRWPWRGAAGHLAVLALIGLILAELCLRGAHKIPFTCSYLPGKSNLHVTFWLCVLVLPALVAKAAELEVRALSQLTLTASLLGVLLAVWLTLRWWTTQAAESEGDSAQFEDAPADEVLTLKLSGSGAR